MSCMNSLDGTIITDFIGYGNKLKLTENCKKVTNLKVFSLTFEMVKKSDTKVK